MNGTIRNVHHSKHDVCTVTSPVSISEKGSFVENRSLWTVHMNADFDYCSLTDLK